jgi:hypothetical protein
VASFFVYCAGKKERDKMAQDSSNEVSNSNLLTVSQRCVMQKPVMGSLKFSRIAIALLLAGVTGMSYAQWSNPADDIPAYHPSAPLKVSSLPPILSGAKLTGANFQYPWQVHVYQQAAKVSSVLYQLPCNCRCDRALGHTSLRSCFEGLHGTECSTCAKEGAFAYQQTKLGKSPKEIRAAIERKEYESISLEKL